MTPAASATGRRRLLLALAGGALGAPAAAAQVMRLTGSAPPVPPEVAGALPGARLIGAGRLTFFGLHVYDARLWARDDFKPADFADTALAIEVEYARTISARQLADRSLTEIKRSGAVPADKAARWLALMLKVFTDVKEGDRLTGVQLPGSRSRFFANGRPNGDVDDAEFTQRFFGIWLSPSTSEPKLRAALLGPRNGNS